MRISLISDTHNPEISKFQLRMQLNTTPWGGGVKNAVKNGEFNTLTLHFNNGKTTLTVHQYFFITCSVA